MNMKVLGSLGYTQALPTKYLAYDHEKCLHMFSVVIAERTKDQTKLIPDDIFLSRVCVTTRDGNKHVDGDTFRATLQGDLIAGMRGVGRAGDVVQNKLDCQDRAVKARYQELMSFFLNKSRSLPRLQR